MTPFRYALIAAATIAASSPAVAEGGGAPAPSAGGACENPTGFCQRQLDAECLSRVGAGSIAFESAPAGCDAQFTAYRDCLALVAGQCGPGDNQSAGTRDIAPVDGATMTAIWNEIKDSGNADALESFATSYPDSPLAILARSRAAALRADPGASADRGASTGLNDDLRAQSSAACAKVIAALEPFLERADERTRDVVRQGSADGRYSLPMLYYRTSAGTPKFRAEHGPRLDQWREAVAAFRLVAPDDAVRRIDFFDQIIRTEIEEARFMNRGQMLAWLATLDSKGADFKARCRRLVQN